MATFIRIKLKNAKDFLTKKEYAKAQQAAEKVLLEEPDNFNANVFFGLASSELGEYEKSEQAYRKAIESKPDQITPWQGLAKLYEHIESWDKYADTLRSMMDIYLKSEDATKCAESYQKYLELRRKEASRSEVIEILYDVLPGSRYYDLLSTLPPPDPTAPAATTTFWVQSAVHNSLPIFEEIIASIEQSEEMTFKKEVERRRTRINAGTLDDVRKEVGRDIWSVSKLPSLYQEILNHPNTSDDLRRLTESKLLRYKQNYLRALPASDEFRSDKAKVGEEVAEIIEGMVLLKIPDELAWAGYIETQNAEQIDDYDFKIMRNFIGLFPESILTKLLVGYFLYSQIPLSEGEDGDKEGELPKVLDDAEDPVNQILDAFGLLTESVLSHRIAGEVYLDDQDYENAMKVAERGLSLTRQAEVDSSKDLSRVRKAFNITLATSLVHHYPPKHHARALRVLDDVLSSDPVNIHCLMGRGYVLQAAKKWKDASIIFKRVTELAGDTDVGLSAREEYAWSLAKAGDVSIGAQALKSVLDEVDTLEGNEERKARVWWRLGTCYWDLGGGQRDDSYRHFITALKRCSTFAPAFTSLGIYYLEHTSPPDPARASKCFQKAFELDAREAEAARRLAEGFADEREWDLVEVVAQRTIEGEGGLEGSSTSTGQAVIASHRPMNAWAWKAMGMVEMNRHNYSAAVTAFQVVLRTNQDDALSWLQLGEAYAKAGRHTAALKALHHSRELSAKSWMCLYLIGDVQRQLGQFSEAIASFEEVLESQPEELGPLYSLAETHLALGRAERKAGYVVRAEDSFTQAMKVALRIVDGQTSFRHLAWKAITDAVLELSHGVVLSAPDSFLAICKRLAPLRSVETRVEGLFDQPIIPPSAEVNGLFALKAAIVLCSYRVSLYTKEEESIASTWFDLASSVHRLAHVTTSPATKEKGGADCIEYTKLALTVDPTNVLYWNAFAHYNFADNPKVAQHAFIRALELDPRDARVWASLGLFYLHHGELPLADEALLKAQTLDPDYTLAWVGQGLVATAKGHAKDSQTLFEHAVSLAADIPGADLEFALRAFRHLSKQGTLYSVDMFREGLLPPFFSLDRYCRRCPNNPSALHLFGLICELLGHEQLALDIVTRAIGFLEASYEESEDPVIEKQYAVANASKGRLLLTMGHSEGALEAFETASGLLEDNTSGDNVSLRALCQFGSGLAHFHSGAVDDAVPLFEAALQTAEKDLLIRGHVTVLLAQTLWSMGDDTSAESARSLLFDCITEDPENIAAVNALAGMGLLTGDDTLVDAALAEILALPLEQRRRRDPSDDVRWILRSHAVAEGKYSEALSVDQQAVHLEPSHQTARQDLASQALWRQTPSLAPSVIGDPSTSGELYGLHRSLRLNAISLVFNEEAPSGSQGKAQSMAQKAVMLAPWERDNWRCLGFVRKATPS